MLTIYNRVEWPHTAAFAPLLVNVCFHYVSGIFKILCHQVVVQNYLRVQHYFLHVS